MDPQAPAISKAEERGLAADNEAPPVGCYVYAFTRAGHHATDAAAVGAPGVDPAFPLEVVRLADVQALVSGVSLAGFTIIVQPAATAGPILRVPIAIGKFHGVIA